MKQQPNASLELLLQMHQNSENQIELLYTKLETCILTLDQCVSSDIYPEIRNYLWTILEDIKRAGASLQKLSKELEKAVSSSF